MFKSIMKMLSIVFLGVFLMGSSGCEPETDTVVMIIKSATSIAFDRVLVNNPDLEDTFYAFAKLNKGIIIEGEVDADIAKRLMTDILISFDDLDDDYKTIILTLFNTIIPMIELPDEGPIKEPQKSFIIAFFDGIMQAVEMRREFKDTVIPPVSWEVWSFMKYSKV